MQSTASLNKSKILYHPFVIGSIIVYILNNHIFQRFWPSSITGKLSDIAWLFFTPIVISSLVASIPQVNRKNQININALIWISIGVVFVALKGRQNANHIFVSFIRNTTGFPVSIVFDPTDLAALVALVGSFFFWRSQSNIKQGYSLKRGLIAVGLVSFITVADMAGPDYGVYCLETTGDMVVASSTYTDFISRDGGESWEEYKEEWGWCEKTPPESQAPMQIGNENLLIQFEPGGPIEISADGGSTWQIEYETRPINQVMEAYYEKFMLGNPIVESGPFNAIIEPNSGNVIFTMGHEGVLIRKSDKTWLWVQVGSYKRIERSPDLYTLISGEFYLALANGLLTFMLVGLRPSKPKSVLGNKAKTAFLIIALLAFAITTILFPPALTSGYDSVIPFIATIFIFVLAIILTGFTLIRLPKELLKRALLYSGIGIIVFFVPYIFWIAMLIPDYYISAGLAIAFQIAVILWGVRKVK